MLLWNTFVVSPQLQFLFCFEGTSRDPLKRISAWLKSKYYALRIEPQSPPALRNFIYVYQPLKSTRPPLWLKKPARLELRGLIWKIHITMQTAIETFNISGRLDRRLDPISYRIFVRLHTMCGTSKEGCRSLRDTLTLEEQLIFFIASSSTCSGACQTSWQLMVKFLIVDSDACHNNDATLHNHSKGVRNKLILRLSVSCLTYQMRGGMIRKAVALSSAVPVQFCSERVPSPTIKSDWPRHKINIWKDFSMQVNGKSCLAV